MTISAAPDTTWIVRRVFPGWSITIPAGFIEPEMGDEPYWHAHDDSSSVSLTSLTLTEAGDPVPSVAIGRQAFPLLARGEAIIEGPPALLSRAWIIDADPPARASVALQGAVAVDGRLLLTTITSDDLEWARRVWRSIRHHDAPPITRAPGPTIIRRRQKRHGPRR